MPEPESDLAESSVSDITEVPDEPSGHQDGNEALDAALRSLSDVALASPAGSRRSRSLSLESSRSGEGGSREVSSASKPCAAAERSEESTSRGSQRSSSEGTAGARSSSGGQQGTEPGLGSRSPRESLEEGGLGDEESSLWKAIRHLTDMVNMSEKRFGSEFDAMKLSHFGLEESLHRQTREQEALRATCASTARSAEHLQDELQRLSRQHESDLMALRKELTASHASAVEALRGDHASARTRIESVEELLASSQRQLEALKVDLEAPRASFADATKSTTAVERAVERLSTSVDASDASVQRVCEEMRTLTAAHEKLARAHEKTLRASETFAERLKSIEDGAEKTNSTLSAELRDVQSRTSRLEESVDVLSEQIVNLPDALGELRGYMKDMEDRVVLHEDLDEAKRGFSTDLATLRNVMQEHSEALGELRGSIKDMEDRAVLHEDLDEAKRGFSTDLATLRNVMQEHSDAFGELRGSIKDMEDRVVLHEDLDDAKRGFSTDLATLRNVMNQHSDALGELRGCITDMGDRVVLHEDLDEAKRAFSTDLTTLRNMMDEHSDRRRVIADTSPTAGVLQQVQKCMETLARNSKDQQSSSIELVDILTRWLDERTNEHAQSREIVHAQLQAMNERLCQCEQRAPGSAEFDRACSSIREELAGMETFRRLLGRIGRRVRHMEEFLTSARLCRVPSEGPPRSRAASRPASCVSRSEGGDGAPNSSTSGANSGVPFASDRNGSVPRAESADEPRLPSSSMGFVPLEKRVSDLESMMVGEMVRNRSQERERELEQRARDALTERCSRERAQSAGQPPAGGLRAPSGGIVQCAGAGQRQQAVAASPATERHRSASSGAANLPRLDLSRARLGFASSSGERAGYPSGAGAGAGLRGRSSRLAEPNAAGGASLLARSARTPLGSSPAAAAAPPTSLSERARTSSSGLGAPVLQRSSSAAGAVGSTAPAQAAAAQVQSVRESRQTSVRERLSHFEALIGSRRQKSASGHCAGASASGAYGAPTATSRTASAPGLR
eukprot:TRINITY_DN3831_c0_g1_i1.p1 TRINITY_DN3831_c0_g1~~TRINITY_DN3831_c0_g1_i1.p1  ORF type:complete len:1179 (-),score=255.16 TRINITY_DN3831_c0_g1_i1:128-3193(-)